MPLKLRVDTELNDRSVSDTASKAKSAFDAVSKEIGVGLSRGITSELDKIGPSFVHMGSAGKAAMAEVGTSAETALSGISTGALGAAAGIAGIGTAVLVAGKQLYDLGAMWDTVADNLVGATGAMGSELNSLVDIVQKVGDESTISFDQISKFAGGVTQTLHLTDDAARRLTQTLADIQQVTGQIVDMRGLGQAFRLFDVEDVEAQHTALENLTAASQELQIPINTLVNTFTKSGKAAKEAGLDFDETLGLIMTLQEAGVGFDKIGSSLSIAMRNWSKDGRDANQALAETVAQIKAFIDAGNDPAAKALASQTFGRGYIDFLDAIRNGKLDVDNLIDGLQALGNTQNLIERQKKATEDWQEEWKKLTHHLSSVFKPAADYVFGTINHQFQQAADTLKGISDGVTGLKFGWDALAGFISGHPLQMRAEWTGPSTIGPNGQQVPAPQPPAGPNPLNVFGPNAVAPGAQPPGGPTTLDQFLGLQPPGPPAPPPPPTVLPPGTPNFYKDWYPSDQHAGRSSGPQVPYPPGYTGTPVEKAQHDIAQAQADLAAAQAGGDQNAIISAQNNLKDKQIALQQAQQGGPAGSGPQVPYPPGYGVLRPGETAEQYGKEQAVYEATHKRQEAEAQLAALQSSGTATTDQLVKANNDLIKARSDEQQAILRLNESTDKASQNLDDIGAKLDADFGISRGLPGLVENLTRFIGNIAMAGPLAALQKMAGGAPEGAGGLIGMGAVSGVFGPQYVGLPGRGGGGGGGGGTTTYSIDQNAYNNQMATAGWPGAPPGYYSGPQQASNAGGLLPITQAGRDALNARYPGHTIGGYRQDAAYPNEHPAGKALDFMLQQGTAEGYADLSYALSLPGVDYVIFDSKMWYRDGRVEPYTGSSPHTDHLHIHFEPGGPNAPADVPVGQVQPPARQSTAGPAAPQRPVGAAPPGQTWNYQQGKWVPAPGRPGAPPQASLNPGPGSVPGQNPLTAPYQYDEGGWLPPGVTVAQNNTGKPELVVPPPAAPPPAPLPPPGPPPGTAASGVGAGPAPGPTPIGGVGPPAGYGGGLNVGGGLIGLAESAAIQGGALAIDAMAPGAGEAAAIAAQIGISEINRAIKTAGQYAGIAVGGVMETFLPAGASQLAQSNWLTRIAGGLAGATPQLPNLAGKPTNPSPAYGNQIPPGQLAQMTPEQVAGMAPPMPAPGVHTGSGQPPGPMVNIENYNVVASEDRAGADLARHQMAAATPPPGAGR